MYTNIPTTEVKNIISDLLNKNNKNEEEKKEILNLLDIVLEQNYLCTNEQYYTQNKGLAMGAPTSAILAEEFLQHLEDTQIPDILKKHQITGYYRYIYDF
jgi:RNase adaptor protein for sRNA GlmZ degradation